LRSRVLATNGPSLRLHEQIGFVVEGTLRGEFVIGGRPVDDVLLALQLDDG
jgi:RimJ/RimL family protein N-acetyltransferase